jgi:hypothetical protein
MRRHDTDFLIIGAAKCATTWLQKSLQRSPAFFLPDPELHYFSRDYHRGDEWYFSHFDPAPATAILGEKSNSYLTDPPAAERIHRAMPNVRLVAQIRNPVDRAYSDYCMLLRRGEVSRNIEDHLDPRTAGTKRFIHHGLYGHHFQRFIDMFGRDQLLILFYEDVRSAPEAQLRLLASHVGFAGDPPPPLREKLKDKEAAIVPGWLRSTLRPVRKVLDPIRNTTPLVTLRNAVARQVEYPALRPDLRARLQEFYSDDIMRIENMTHRSLKAWSETAP